MPMKIEPVSRSGQYHRIRLKRDPEATRELFRSFLEVLPIV